MVSFPAFFCLICVLLLLLLLIDWHYIFVYINTGGYLNRIRTTLKYQCPVEHIPPKIEVDLSNLDIGDKVLMSDVVVHPSLKLLSKNENMPVCKLTTIRSEIKEPKETVEMVQKE